MRSLKDILFSVLATVFCIAMAVVPIINHIDSRVITISIIVAAIMIIITGTEIHEYISYKRRKRK